MEWDSECGEGGVKNMMIMEDIVTRLKAFMENEARSCSMDYGCVSPQYVFRMWGGNVSIEDIKDGFKELQKQGIPIVVN